MPEGVHMPRYQEEERIYHKGFRDGYRAGHEDATNYAPTDPPRDPYLSPSMKKRKLTAWNKFVKVNSKKKQYRYASGKVNLKKLGVAYRKTKRGRRGT